MRVVDIEQGSADWHSFRNRHLMATDSVVIAGMSRYRTLLQLWNEKVTGVSEVIQNDNMRRGKELEEPARQYFINITGIEIKPTVIESTASDMQWAAASLDGFNDVQHTIVEIKVHKPEIYSKTLSGYVPEYYRPQFQKQLFVSELDWLYYFPFDGTSGHAVKIYRDEAFIKKMIAAEKEFWDRICNLDPPEPSEKDFEEIQDLEFAQLADQYRNLSSMISELQIDHGKIKDKMIEKAANKNIKCNGLKIQKIIRKGSIDYSAIPALKEVNLNNYRKPPIEYWQIKEIGL